MDVVKEIEGISAWIKNYVNSSGADGVVIGLSGGVDSALSAALAVKALGPEKVFAVAMPCHSTTGDLKDAKLIAKHLGLLKDNFEIVSLNGTLMALHDSFGSRRAFSLRSLVNANVKSRLRW